MVINAYLSFNGNCREAMDFYRDCLGGELDYQTIGDSPFADRLPSRMKETVLHATLTHGSLVLMASDMMDEQRRSPGNTCSLMLSCDSETELQESYARLSQGGKQNHPPETTFWGGMLGDLTDKFGNQWVLHYTRENY